MNNLELQHLVSLKMTHSRAKKWPNTAMSVLAKAVAKQFLVNSLPFCKFSVHIAEQTDNLASSVNLVISISMTGKPAWNMPL